jgi:CBS domain-containing protein
LSGWPDSKDVSKEDLMNAGEICNRDVVVAERGMGVVQAAQLMRQYHVGSLVVCDRQGSTRTPVGVLTDRDLTVAVLAKALDPATLTVGDVMPEDLYTVREEDTVTDVLRILRERGVRRLPVVDRDRALIGIVTLDDLLDIAAEQLHDIAASIRREQTREVTARR